MSTFSPAWLALREPFDAAAREAAAAHLDGPAFAARLHAAAGPDQPVRVVDLGCGTGANLRAMAPRLGGVQHWTMLDHDPAVLDAAIEAIARWASGLGLRVGTAAGSVMVDGPGLRLQAHCVRADLSAAWDSAWFEHQHLVTCCALLDLVSAAWLEALVAQCRQVGAAICWALSVDDRQHWSPADPDDGLLVQAFCAHQRRDKGFGPALGGRAPALAMQRLAQAGYRCLLARSDWQIDGPHGQALLHALVEGMARAAIEQAPQSAPRLEAWRARRQARLSQLRLELGHLDLVGWLEPGA